MPIKAPVAGVAMGLITGDGGELDKYAVLTDIQGMEDALGDMDFKVAGTTQGHHRAPDGHQGPRHHRRDHAAKRWPRPAKARMFIMGKMMEVITEAAQRAFGVRPAHHDDQDQSRTGSATSSAPVAR